MKTLFINIYRDITSSYPNTETFNSGKDNILDGFYISLGMAIADGVAVTEYKPLVAGFVTDKPTEFESFQSQWEELKLILLGKDPEGEFDFQLSSEYLEWLKINNSSVYYQKYQGQHQASVKLDIEELYEDTVDAIRRKVLRYLQENDNYKNFDEFVINDNQVTRRSKLVRAIKDKYEDNIAFVSYEKWLEGTKEEVCPKCGKKPCECKREPPVCSKCGKNPCECHNKETRDTLIVTYKKTNHDDDGFAYAHDDANEINIFRPQSSNPIHQGTYGQYSIERWENHDYLELTRRVHNETGVEERYNEVSIFGISKDLDYSQTVRHKSYCAEYGYDVKVLNTDDLVQQIIKKNPKYEEVEYVGYSRQKDTHIWVFTGMT